MDQAEIPSLLKHLQSNEDASRKLAVFKLQASISDPSIADMFIASDGLKVLRQLIMTTSGNTLAYALTALSRLLEVEMGWEIFESAAAGALIERMVELIVTHPLVNILRGAMSVLAAVVGHSQSSGKANQAFRAFGSHALRPAIRVFPQFYEMVISQLNSADHLLCGNSLMLLNAMIRDAICKDPSIDSKPEQSVEVEVWPKFINDLKSIGIIEAIYKLMQGSSLQDIAYPLFDFQVLSKLLLKKWRDTEVDLGNSQHEQMLQVIEASSQLENKVDTDMKTLVEITESDAKKRRWRRLGFQTESPAWEFEQSGLLGLMDLSSFAQRDRDGFQMLLQEQAAKSIIERCPIARASLSVTEVLFEFFEIENSDSDDLRSNLPLDDIKNCDSLFQPFILQWPRLHIAALDSFFRLWQQTGAEQEDFGKVVELLRILIDRVVGCAIRTKDIQEVEEEMRELDYHKLRDIQMEMLEIAFEEEWGEHLGQIRDELRNEGIQFMKEQRLRVLLQGAWFPHPAVSKNYKDHNNSQETKRGWQYVKLSHNRRYLHHADFEDRSSKDPPLDSLAQKIDVETISSVVSNISAGGDNVSNHFSSDTIENGKSPETQAPSHALNTRIMINSHVTLPNDVSKSPGPKTGSEKAILTLAPQNDSLASAWLDGLLMLLNQTPITTETGKLIDLVSSFGLKIRLLNVQLNDDFMGPSEGDGVVPSREGLDEDYFYQI